MDEPTKSFDLSPAQQDTAGLIRQLLGERIADRYVDFCRLSAGAFALRASMPVAAHALRELESILREKLELLMDVAVTPFAQESARIAKAKQELKSLGFDDERIKRA